MILANYMQSILSKNMQDHFFQKRFSCLWWLKSRHYPSLFYVSQHSCDHLIDFTRRIIEPSFCETYCYELVILCRYVSNALKFLLMLRISTRQSRKWDLDSMLIETWLKMMILFWNIMVCNIIKKLGQGQYHQELKEFCHSIQSQKSFIKQVWYWHFKQLRQMIQIINKISFILPMINWNRLQL